MSAIVTSQPGLWFAFIGSKGEAGLITPDGYEQPRFTEALSIKKILLGAEVDAEG